jgi:hypothetical protein
MDSLSNICIKLVVKPRENRRSTARKSEIIVYDIFSDGVAMSFGRINDPFRHRQHNPLLPRAVKPSTYISIYGILQLFLIAAAIDKLTEIANINLELCSVHL